VLRKSTARGTLRSSFSKTERFYPALPRSR
jgi:hypothetical protein